VQTTLAWLFRSAAHEAAKPVRRQAAENLYGGVYVYELDTERRLVMVGRAETAAQDATGRWVLTNYSETRLGKDETKAVT